MLKERAELMLEWPTGPLPPAWCRVCLVRDAVFVALTKETGIELFTRVCGECAYLSDPTRRFGTITFGGCKA